MREVTVLDDETRFKDSKKLSRKLALLLFIYIASFSGLLYLFPGPSTIKAQLFPTLDAYFG